MSEQDLREAVAKVIGRVRVFEDGQGWKRSLYGDDATRVANAAIVAAEPIIAARAAQAERERLAVLAEQISRYQAINIKLSNGGYTTLADWLRNAGPGED